MSRLKKYILNDDFVSSYDVDKLLSQFVYSILLFRIILVDLSWKCFDNHRVPLPAIAPAIEEASKITKLGTILRLTFIMPAA